MTRRLRRWLAIALMAVLSLQSVWAVAAATCSHERDAKSGHFGHHEHRHAGTQADQGKSSEKAPTSADIDCSVCHLAGAQIVSAAQGASLVTGDRAWLTVWVLRPEISHPTAIERPQWSRLA